MTTLEMKKNEPNESEQKKKGNGNCEQDKTDKWLVCKENLWKNDNSEKGKSGNVDSEKEKSEKGQLWTVLSGRKTNLEINN